MGAEPSPANEYVSPGESGRTHAVGGLDLPDDALK